MYPQAARTNKEDVDTLLSEIKRLALVVGKSKGDIDDHIKPLTDKLQGAVQDELQPLPEAKDHFDQFYKYVGSS